MKSRKKQKSLFESQQKLWDTEYKRTWTHSLSDGLRTWLEVGDKPWSKTNKNKNNKDAKYTNCG